MGRSPRGPVARRMHSQACAFFVAPAPKTHSMSHICAPLGVYDLTTLLWTEDPSTGEHHAIFQAQQPRA